MSNQPDPSASPSIDRRIARSPVVAVRWFARRGALLWLLVRRGTFHTLRLFRKQKPAPQSAVAVDKSPTSTKATEVRGGGALAWKIATVTGVLALLLMLGLQTSAYFFPPTEGESAESQPEPQPPDEANDESTRLVHRQSETENAGFSTTRFPTGFPAEEPANRESDEPIEPEFHIDEERPDREPESQESIAAQSSRPKPADEPDDRFDLDRPFGGDESPFGKSPTEEPAESPQKPATIGLGEPEPAKPPANPFGGPFDPEPGSKRPDPPAVAHPFEADDKPGDESESDAPRPSLALEVVRTNASGPNDDDRFLVTSTGKSDGGRTDDGVNPPIEFGGWTAVRWSNEGDGILPVRYSVRPESPGTVAAGQTPGRATAHANWPVVDAKLTYRILAPKGVAVGEQVPIRLLITNAGAAAAENVELHVDLPAELKYRVGRRLRHRVGTLEPGKTRVAKLTATAVRDGDIRISGEAVAGEAKIPAECRMKIAGRKQAALRNRVLNRATTDRCCIPVSGL